MSRVASLDENVVGGAGQLRVDVQHASPAHVAPATDSSSAIRLTTHAASTKVIVDLVAGTAAGTAQLMVGHPFDTIKVKLQSQSSAAAAAKFNGPLDAARQTLAAEGLKGMYKGMGAPLATVALFNAVLFASRGQMEVLLAHADGSHLTVRDEMVAAVGASAAVSLLACPTELLKCRLQAQGSAATARQRLLAAGADMSKAVIYRGPLDVARHVMRHEGGLPGLYKGLGATLLREGLGNIAMFGTYELIKQQLVEYKGMSSTSQLSQADVLLAGGLGGTAFWLACYPVDVVKSKLQVDSYSAPRYRGMLDCARQVLAAENYRGLFRGFGPALARSFPANAVCFAVYEATQSRLSRAVGIGEAASH